MKIFTSHTEIEVLESVADLGPELYAELEGPERFPFLRREWLLAFERTGCLGRERGWIPCSLALWRGSLGQRELVAFAPSYIKLHSMGEFVFDHAWADFAERRLGVDYYPKLVMAVPFTPATGPRVLFRKGLSQVDRERSIDALAEAIPVLSERLGLSSVHVLFPGRNEAEQLEERGLALRLGTQFHFPRGGAATFDDYLTRFRSKRRAAIRRERRGVQERGFQVSVLTGAELTVAHAEYAYELYLTTVDKYAWGRRYLTRAFFVEVARTVPEIVHFVVVHRRGQSTLERPIAGAFNLLGAEALYGRYWGAFEEVPFLHFEVCLYRGVEETIRLGRDRFEPGAGGEHKEGRGFERALTYSVHHLVDERLDRAVRDYLARERDAVLAYVEQGDSGGGDEHAREPA